ncbi:MAG: DUF302 domain-containing protein [Chlorobiales bacterium]|nr:DUF302 domain-containing protein [Chlorobiales bacterium]
MTYYYNREVSLPFEQAVEKVVEELKNAGFGVMTEIDVTATLKKKIDVDFRKYKILGACEPTVAHRLLQLDDKAGVMMPCNVIVQEKENGKTEVAAINPAVTMQVTGNAEVLELVANVRDRLKKAVDQV